MLRTHLSAVLIFSLLTVGAYAQTAGDALKEFGLGIWSEDCGKDSSKTLVRSMVYTAPTFGRPKVTAGNASGRNEIEIQTVSRLSEDKLKYVFVYKRMGVGGVAGERPPPVEPEEMIIQKVGYQIRIFSQRSIDGKTIRIENGMYKDTSGLHPEPLWEKCLN